MIPRLGEEFLLDISDYLFYEKEHLKDIADPEILGN
jgi:hypothetical protein